MKTSRQIQDLLVQWEDALQSGQEVSAKELCHEHPELLPELREKIELLKSMYQALGVSDPPSSNGARQTAAIKPGETSAHRSSHQAAKIPEQIGRYRVDRILGRGGFGRVYLAHDDALRRQVAIKVPHADRVATRKHAELFLSEARVVASLDHASIVPVYDVDQTDDGLCYVVSKYIEGHDLVSRLGDARRPTQESVELVTIVAEALHYAHCHGVVHRDIKPANIRIATDGRPYLLDFGIALTEDEFGNDVGLAGTPAYMSPEQVWGESHLVDGRSDIFSLGIVFYELLTGVQPFQESDWPNALDRMIKTDVRPPRQVDDTLPKELERICLKALSRRASDRYTTAKDMADDLRHYLEEPVATKVPAPLQPQQTIGAELPLVVPKGLRSFDAGDADFFLNLLPGPRNRDGLPESIRFWKTRVEETDPDETFRVGLIYGPSGSGKSSLVKAGLLPHLASHVIPVYAEATADETESRLISGLNKRCPNLPVNLNLADTLAAIRHGEVVCSGQKVLIVLDQFEQWLHANQRGSEIAGLTRALRQCDGQHVQCIVMVRDDFWMAATRFFLDLDVRLSDGDNSAAVELFDALHARQVLRQFGRAFGCLPKGHSSLTLPQRDFLDQAIAGLGLARDGKIVCVRLSLFAEMVKGKPWTPATLRAVGGTEGVGVAFLEETFSSPAAPPEQRLHQDAARAILKVLLPESGIDIKGSMRSRAELMEASGYAHRMHDFEQVVQILDSKVRLMTPIDLTENNPAIPSPNDGSPAETPAKFYQLTHDYLVPSLRAWLTKKQKETRRGRAELRLAERSAAWNAKPERRNLPNWWEYLGIQIFTNKTAWLEPQRLLMREAGRHLFKQGALLFASLAAVVFAGFMANTRFEARRKADYAEALVQRLVDADIANTRDIIVELGRYQELAQPRLEAENRDAPESSARKLHTALALLPDPAQVDYLHQQMVIRPPREFMVIRDAVAVTSRHHVDHLWEWALDERRNSQQRFQSACALASYAPTDARWKQIRRFISGHLVSEPPSHLMEWTNALSPVRKQLVDPLMTIYRDRDRDNQERLFAVVVLTEFSGRVEQLFDLLRDANSQQFEAVYAGLAQQRERVVHAARQIVSAAQTSTGEAATQERNARQRSLAAVVLLRMDEPKVAWELVAPLLEHRSNPITRSLLIAALDPPAIHASIISKRLDEERDPSIRSGLVFALRKADLAQNTKEERQALDDKLLQMYRDEPDPGLHSALDWMLRARGKIDQLATIDNELATGNVEGRRRWYVNRESQTMAVIPGPHTFMMGSPTTEQPRDKREQLHRRHISRSFSIATKEVTVDQFQRFLTAQPSVRHAYLVEDSPQPDCPQTSVDWYEAAHYCNWLSQQDGIAQDQWCYLPERERGLFPGENGVEKDLEIELASDYLSLSGYRLPTEAEWECACRSGTSTKRYYGNTDELLADYAWYANSAQRHTSPVGLLQPNRFGLFDMHGNVFEWCQTTGQLQPEIVGDWAEDHEPANLIVDPRTSRALKGGSFQDFAGDVRAAVRGGQYPAVRTRTVGFRPARTIQP